MNPGNLPSFNEGYIQYFDSYSKSFEIRRKSRADSNISLSEAMEYIDGFLKLYQLTYIPNKIDKNILLFPFLFVPPHPGDRILNLATKESYTVDQIINNPSSGNWEGLVRLDLRNAPSLEDSHKLVYTSPERYVVFNHEVPDALPNPIGANLESLIKQPPPLKPTITWTVKSVEPGTLGTIGSSRKEWKPRLRESFKDPLVKGHTVQVFGQLFDNIVQFDCWSNDPRTSDRLVRWFEQFIRLYTDNLRRYGLAQVLFWKRSADGFDQTWRQAFNVRSTQFMLRTEELEALYTRDILKIDISISADKTAPFNKRLNETRWIADQMVSGNITSEQYKNLFYRSGEYLFGDIDILQ